MFEYEIKRFNRRCSKTDREFKPGDVYYSVLIEDGDEFLRKDFSLQAWEGPPPGAIGWWRCQVAAQQPDRAYWAPAAVLLEYFGKLIENPDKREECYLMALALLRRKLLSLMENRCNDQGINEMVVQWTRTKQVFTVPVCEPSPDRLPQLQQSLCEQLFTDRPLDSVEAELAPATEIA